MENGTLDLRIGFSPLFIGAWVVGDAAKEEIERDDDVSVPYSSGLGLSGFYFTAGRWCPCEVSVPYSSGLGLSGPFCGYDREAVVRVSVPYSSGLGLSGH